MIRQAVLYLAAPGDEQDARLAVAGHPVAFRALMAAVRAGARRVALPPVLRDPALERAIAATPSARAAAVWLEPDAPPPDEPTWLLPATTLTTAASLAALGAGPSPAWLADAPAGAPVAAADAPLVRELWGGLVAGTPAGEAIRSALDQRGAASRDHGRAAAVIGPRAGREAERGLYAGLGSAVDTRLDRAFHRRLSRPLSRLAVKAGVRPNPISVASLLVGLAAAVAFWQATPGQAVLGLALYAASVVLDHVDGEVARLMFQESALGEWLDVTTDTLVHAAVVVALGAATQALAGNGGLLLGVVAAMGVGGSAAVAKTSPPGGAAGLASVFDELGNRDGFYVMLLAFILGLLTLPAALPILMLVVAFGSHAYWLARLAHRLAAPGALPRRPKTLPNPK